MDIAKYTEFLVSKFKIISPKDLYSLSNNEGFQPNIYFILGLKKYYYSKETKIIDKNEGAIYIKLQSKDGDIIETNTILTDSENPYISKGFNPLVINKLSFNADMSEMIINEKFRYSFDYIYPWIRENTTKHKVLYIGQGQGSEDNPRDAIIRLKDHNTLQKILADCNGNYLNYKIELLLLEFQQINFFTNLGKVEEAHMHLSDEIPFDSNLFKVFPEHSQTINFIEAVLINYFKPEYNVKFIKGIVPKKQHSSYNRFYSENYNSSILNLKALDIGILYTDSVEFDARKKGYIDANINEEKSFDEFLNSNL